MKNVVWRFVERSITFAEVWRQDTEDGLGFIYNGPLLDWFSEQTVIEIMPYVVFIYLFLADLIALG